MVIWFNVEKAKDFLLKNGYVYTLRSRKRREGKDVLMYNCFGKKGYVNIKFIKEILDWNELNRYVYESGFRNVDEWIREARGSRFLYLVTLLKSDE